MNTRQKAKNDAKKTRNEGARGRSMIECEGMMQGEKNRRSNQGTQGREKRNHDITRERNGGAQKEHKTKRAKEQRQENKK